MESTDGETSEETFNAGDAYEPAADANEPSGSESYRDDAGMSNDESGNAFGSESTDNAYQPAENVGEAYGRSYEPDSEAAETPSFESNPADESGTANEFGTDNESTPVAESSMDNESGTDNEFRTENEFGAENDSATEYDSGMDNPQSDDAGKGYSEGPACGDDHETTESASEPTASGSEYPYMGVALPAQGRSAFEIIKAWTEHSLSNFDGAIRNIALPTVWLELPSLTGVAPDERTANDAVRAGEPASF